MTPFSFGGPRSAWTPEERARQLTRWRVIMFAATWLTYVVFYLTRKNYPSAQPAFMQELGWSEQEVGIIASSFLVVYAAGQFINGVLGERLGPRAMIGLGLGLTALMSIGLGFSSSIAVMALLYGITGYAQAVGWPALTQTMTNWTPVSQRGRIMGLWGTNYPLGDALGTALAATLLGIWGWRSAFLVPGALTLVAGLLIMAFYRGHPRDVGLSLRQEAVGGGAGPKMKISEALRFVASFKVITFGLAYFCLKFVRYTFFFWMSIYLVTQHDFTPANAAWAQVPYALGGFGGSLLAGWLSDRVFDTRRAPAAALMLGGLTFAIFLLHGSDGSFTSIALIQGLAGFFLFGPDMLISGAAAMDLGDEKATSVVAGFVNGLGSIGAASSPVVVGFISATWGSASVFYTLMVFTLLAGGITASLWNVKGKAG